MRRLFTMLVVAAAACSTLAQEPTHTDGDKYKLVLENDCLRVLSYRDQPGEQTQQHTHPAFVVIAVEPFKRTITLPDGKVMTREFKAGDVMWSDAQTHVGRNVGSTPSHAILVELKKAGPGCSAR